MEVDVIVDLAVAYAPVNRLALALNQMPSGSSLVIRDASGRDWHITPARQAAMQSLREAA
jgi:hypothetical protein